MIDVHIRFTSGPEIYRTVNRIDVSEDGHSMVIFATNDKDSAEKVVDAMVRVYMGGQFIHTYRV